MPLNPEVSRLVLGTAQLGMSYGIANRTGQPDYASALDMVKIAWECGVRCFDTAQVYGQSESILGRIFRELGIQAKVRVISKISPQLDLCDTEAVYRSVVQSLKCLGLSRFHGLLIHQEETLENADGRLGCLIARLKQAHLVEHAGGSVYALSYAEQVMNTSFLDLLQFPASAVDHRFARAGILDHAQVMGKTIFIRSVFLQGLLLMEPAAIPPHMAFAKATVMRFRQLARDYALTPVQAAMGFVRLAYPHAYVLFGAETAQQVRTNLADWNTDCPEQLMAACAADFADVDEMILNPMLWPGKPDHSG
ncbi:MAG: aldo/keto reductase [Verrucomicrobia bacterium]|nr:aldo/keto reductase [Verrucomicrobiota bacterium]